MLNFKSNLVMILVLFALSLACAPGCTAKSKVVTQDSNTGGNSLAQQQQSGSAEIVRNPTSGGSKEGMNILAEGSYGQVSAPFVAVTRDPLIYSALRRMVRELPELGDDFFKSNSVVAVFPGLRNTGGYSVEVTQSGKGRLLVSERMPPPDAMTTQAITKPFKIVSVPTKEDEDVTLILQGGLATSLLRPYRVVSGEFVSAGAARERAEKFRLEGGLGVARYGGLATVFFDLKEAGAKGPSVARAVVTGVVDQGGRFSTASLHVKPARGLSTRRLRVTGQFTTGGDKLQLAFEPSLPVAAQGSGGSGKLVAVASGPAPTVANPDESMY